ncbi:MAG: ECF transporter S component [Symbiobacteriaceae bacterium]|nr:ECF transporter S component [Symbiobacteriaceae bacterium]
MVTAALFAALVTVATVVVAIPLPGQGYANLGDGVVILTGCLLGPLWGGLAAAVGSLLADIYLGFALYAVASFMIKGLMAVVAYFVYTWLFKLSKKAILAVVSASLLGEVIMVGGYYLFEERLWDGVVALASLPGNILQGGVGVMTASLILLALNKSRLLSKWQESLHATSNP